MARILMTPTGPIKNYYLVIPSRLWVEVTREGKRAIFALFPSNDLARCLAVMFAKLGMTVKDALEEFNKICDEVYAVELEPEDRTTALRNRIEDLLKKRGLPVDLKMGKDKRGPVSKCGWYVLNRLDERSQF
jgi:hypothetical protein